MFYKIDFVIFMAQKCGPHIEQWSDPSRIISKCIRRARSGSSDRLNWSFQRISYRAWLICRSRSAAPGLSLIHISKNLQIEQFMPDMDDHSVQPRQRDGDQRR